MGALNQQLVLCEDRGAVRVLTMNRPESRNALNTDLISALHTALVQADRDASVRAVVLTGADPAFCAGLDLKQAQRDGAIDKSAFTDPILADTEIDMELVQAYCAPVGVSDRGWVAYFSSDQISSGPSLKRCNSRSLGYSVNGLRECPSIVGGIRLMG